MIPWSIGCKQLKSCSGEKKITFTLSIRGIELWAVQLSINRRMIPPSKNLLHLYSHLHFHPSFVISDFFFKPFSTSRITATFSAKVKVLYWTRGLLRDIVALICNTLNSRKLKWQVPAIGMQEEGTATGLGKSTFQRRVSETKQPRVMTSYSGIRVQTNFRLTFLNKNFELKRLTFELHVIF